MELFQDDDGRLVTEQEWFNRLDALKDSVGGDLKQALVDAVLKRAQDCPKPIGIFFSGGVDSTLIAFILKQHNIPFTGYTAGFQDEGTKEPEDIVESQKVAEKLDFAQKMVVVTLAEAHELFQKTARILSYDSVAKFSTPQARTQNSVQEPGLLRPATPPTPVASAGVDGTDENFSPDGDKGADDISSNDSLVSTLSLGVGGVEVAAAELALVDGCKTLFAGLGSEEIFAGYERHEKLVGDSDAIQEECWRGLYGMWARDLRRDCKIAEQLGLTVPTPFLDEAVIRAAMGVPGSEKIRDFEGRQYKKFILRQVAEELGLPHEFAFRPKRAAQYGSRLDSALAKLAKKRGFARKQEYIDSLK